MYRSLFALLASDEILHESRLEYPSFGDSGTAYAADATHRSGGPLYVRDFYSVWTEFATAKRFEWVGKWDVERGDDRGIRRLMEKENKKTRDDYRREYNDAVRVSLSLSALRKAIGTLRATSRSEIQGLPGGAQSGEEESARRAPNTST